MIFARVKQTGLVGGRLLVLPSSAIGPRSMDLAFSRGPVLMVIAAVWITGQVASDGRSHRLRGSQLLEIYLILALVYLIVPRSVPR